MVKIEDRDTSYIEADRASNNTTDETVHVLLHIGLLVSRTATF